MRKALRILSLAMLAIAAVFAVTAFLSMGSTITLPFTVGQLHLIYKVYLIVTAALFAASCFGTDTKKGGAP